MSNSTTTSSPWVEAALYAVLRKVRPGAASSGARLVDVAGWYLRKGVGPVVRGTVRRPMFGTVAGLCFVGSGVRISYPRRIRLGSHVSIGAGSMINAFSQEGVHLGSGVTLRENAWVQCSSSPDNPGVGLHIGDGTYIGPNALIGVGGPVRIGARCQIGASLVVVAENHLTDDAGHVDAKAVSRDGITIGPGCWIGHRVTILDGVTLGEGCVVGAGAVVTKSYPAGTRLAGVPARPIERTAAR